MRSWLTAAALLGCMAATAGAQSPAVVIRSQNGGGTEYPRLTVTTSTAGSGAGLAEVQVGDAYLTVTNADATATNQYGLRGLVTGATVTGTKYGVYGQLSGSASVGYGLYSDVTGATTNYGLYSSGSGAQLNYGGFGSASGGSLGAANYGLYGVGTVSGGGSTAYGVYGSGATYGVYGSGYYGGVFAGTNTGLEARLSAQNYAQLALNSGTAGYFRTQNVGSSGAGYSGIRVEARNDYSGTNTGIWYGAYVDAWSANTGASQTGTMYGTWSRAVAEGAGGVVYGVYGVGHADTTSSLKTAYGGYFSTQTALSSSSRLYGVVGIASAGTGAGSHYGGYFVGSGGSINWGVYADGNVATTGGLYTGGTAAANQRLTSAGVLQNATWNGTAIASGYGGTGQNSSGWTGVPSVSAGTWAINAVLPTSLGGTGVSTTFTPGSVVFAGSAGFAQDNVKLFWDDTNDRLGIGTSAPGDTLQVNGTAQIGGTGSPQLYVYTSTSPGNAISGNSFGSGGAGRSTGLIGRGNGASESIGVLGESSTDGGVGVRGENGTGDNPANYTAVFAYNDSVGAGSQYGFQTLVRGATAGTNYGLYATASNAPTNYAVYARALGGSANWAGYFSGDLGVSGRGTLTYSQANPTLAALEVVQSGTTLPAGTSSYAAMVVQGNAGDNDALLLPCTSAALRGEGLAASRSTTTMESVGLHGLSSGSSATGTTTNVGVLGEGTAAGATNYQYGVIGRARTTGASGYHYGVRGHAGNSSGSNYGVYGSVPEGAGTAYGLYGEALSSGTNYGLYATGSSWAGYFAGAVTVYGSNDPLLTLSSPAGGQSVLQFGTAGTAKWAWYVPSGGADLSLWHYQSPAKSYVTFNGSTGDITLNGDVGVGTTPAYRLHVDGGSDAALGSGGYLVTGATTGLNIAIDNNELMARNNGAASTLTVQHDGGDIHMFANTTGGRLGVGTSAPDTLTRVEIENDGNFYCLICDRDSDGNLIRFTLNNALQGWISMSAGTVSYNAFTGSHLADSPLKKDLRRGMVLVATGRSTGLDPAAPRGQTEVVYEVSTTDRAYDKRVLGVFSEIFTEGEASPSYVLVAAVGNGMVLVTDSGGDIEVGDYVTTSCRPGYGQRQEGEALMNHTLGKAMEDVRWAEVEVDPKLGFKWKLIHVTFKAG